MRGRRLRDRLRNGDAILNVMVPFGSPNVVEILGAAGVDCVMIDAEHGAIDLRDCEEMIRAAEVVDLPALVRVPLNEASAILRVLDAGASGIIVPHVSTPAAAQAAVAAARYAPDGARGYGSPRASRYGLGDAASYVRRANDEIVVFGLFEDADGIDQLDLTCATAGLDALIVGPNDLSFSMGLPAQPWHPSVQAVVDRVIAATAAAGIATGLPASGIEQVRQHRARGCRVISVGIAGLLASAAAGLTAALRT